MGEVEPSLAAAQGGDEQAFRALVAPYQRELRAYCYRMSGSLADADDLLQESLLRVWRGLGGFAGRASLRTWLYRVTWSACADSLERRPPRTMTADRGPPADPRAPFPEPPQEGWPDTAIGPCPESLYQDHDRDAPSPEARYGLKESVSWAFLAALQLLPPRQRATLLLRDVLGFSAEEVAELVGGSVPAVNSALQRARETLEARAGRLRPARPSEAVTERLLGRYLAAWESADVGALVALLHEEATLAMPPIPLWLRGPEAIGATVGAMVFVPGAAGTLRLLPTELNGLPAFAMYRRSDDGWRPAALHVLGLRDDRIGEITAFLDGRLHERMGLPERI